MTKQALPQSQKRFHESLGSLFDEKKQTSEQLLFVKSSSDVGVIRNGGRNGARFAPQSFLSTFRKFSQNDSLKKFSFSEIEVSNVEEEVSNFHEAQKKESDRILTALKDQSWICHLGGGHDHIYPLLRAISADSKKVVVINIDAHADTRTDEDFHSGTPFRQFSEEFAGEFHLFQIGLNPFANSFSTLSPLNKGKHEILWKKDFQNLVIFFQKISNVAKDATVIFSIDADALTASEVPGVSAINPSGITREELLIIWKKYRELSLTHKPVLGIYELNPLYDSLGSLSMRTMGSFLFEAIG